MQKEFLEHEQRFSVEQPQLLPLDGKGSFSQYIKQSDLLPSKIVANRFPRRPMQQGPQYRGSPGHNGRKLNFERTEDWMSQRTDELGRSILNGNVSSNYLLQTPKRKIHENAPTLEDAWPDFNVDCDDHQYNYYDGSDISSRKLHTARGILRVKCFEVNRLAEPKTVEEFRPGSHTVDLSNKLLGDTHLIPSLKSFSLVRKNLTMLNLSENRLSDAVASQIVTVILKEPGPTLSLDFSRNKMGSLFVGALSKCCASSDGSCLGELRLASCNIKEASAVQLLKCLRLMSPNKLRSLDLSDNAICDLGGNAAGDLVEDEHLMELKLQNCRIRATGFERLMSVLHQNKTLTDLDVSMNSLGRRNIMTKKKKLLKESPPKEATDNVSSDCCICSDNLAISMLCNAIRSNKTLTHLNLDDNFIIEEDDCRSLSEAFKPNHSIIGLHCEGNNRLEVDSLGFVNILDDNDPRMLSRKCKMCWICDGWTSHSFRFHASMRTSLVKECSIGMNGNPMLHLSFDDGWEKGHEMRKGRGDNDKEYTLTRVCPTGVEFGFFFTIPPSHNIFHDPFKPLASKKTTSKMTTMPNISSCVEFINGVVRTRKLDKNFNKKDKELFPGCWPRPEMAITSAVSVSARPPWCLQSSIFRNYKLETSSHLPFKRDRMMKGIDTMGKLIRCDRVTERICNLCDKHHEILRDVFRLLACKNFSLGNVISFTIDMATFLEFVSDLGIGGSLPHSFITIAFAAALNILPGKPRDVNNSPKALVRGEFIEALLRLAVARVSNDAKNINLSEVALEDVFSSIIETCIVPHAQRFLSKLFAVNRLYNHEVEDTIVDNMQKLHIVYDCFSGKLAGPSDERTMCLDEWTELMLEAVQRSQSFPNTYTITQREITFAFVFGKMPETDREEKTNRDDPTKMRFFEFIVALAMITEFATNGVDNYLYISPEGTARNYEEHVSYIKALPPLVAPLLEVIRAAVTVASRHNKKKNRK